jgi:ketosteroid isomerase-like protein
MTELNKQILKQANAAVIAGDYEGFLFYCTEDTEWNFIGDQVLKGKEAVRRYIQKTYIEPPKFEVSKLISEGNFVVAVGKITLKDEHGTSTEYNYCDVWQLREGKLHELKAYVI